MELYSNVIKLYIYLFFFLFACALKFHFGHSKRNDYSEKIRTHVSVYMRSMKFSDGVAMKVKEMKTAHIVKRAFLCLVYSNIMS